MQVTYSDNYFSIYTKEALSARIKTNDNNFDEILSLFLTTSQTEDKKKSNKIRFY